ncbi:MAG: hypothetical protein LBP59_19695 [Planctomycetaceae bacterium]|nr:hypothetical protein [Planctomycetaceae bacterium]
MPEYRRNPLTGQVVIVSAERSERPHHFDIESGGNGGDRVGGDVGIGGKLVCPFCEGNEYLTAGELDAIRDVGSVVDGIGWRVRVIPNKYPAVCGFSGISTYREFCGFSEFGDISFIPAVGSHEVLVDVPRHVISVSDMTLCETIDMFRMYRKRLNFHLASGCWVYVQIFKNVGVAAGASIPHSHSQLISIPFVPLSVLGELRRAAEYRERGGNSSNGGSGNGNGNGGGDCFWCDLLLSEAVKGLRVVEETGSFMAICPFASRFAAEVEIYPKNHESFLESLADEVKLGEFADLVRRTVIRLERAAYWVRGKLAYNFVLHVEPFVHNFGQNIFHWRISILPSLARAAGFEWGTGLHINPIPPETAAKKLREINLENEI